MNFDKEARTWDEPRRMDRAGILAGKLLTAIGDARGKVLDFGCGTGLLTFLLAPHVETIYGYDPSSEMRNMFLQKIESSGATNVQLLSDPELGEHKFDGIFTSMVMHHIRDYRAELVRIKGLLNPGGRFFWIDLDPEGGAFHKGEPDFDGHDGFERNEVTKALMESGFHKAAIETAYEGVKMVEGAPVAYTLFLAAAE